jgi:hypothetical protein
LPFGFSGSSVMLNILKSVAFGAFVIFSLATAGRQDG